LTSASHLAYIRRARGAAFLRGEAILYDELHRLLAGIGKPRICVVGDVMLDTYVWGRVSRVSPEGPIPVLHVDSKEHRPGGAAGLAVMLCALGAQVCLVGAAGEDEAAAELRRELGAAGVDASGLLACPDRPTTLKTRYLGYVQSAGRGLQQIVRVDEEVTDPLAPQQAEAVLRSVRDLCAQAELILIQDMAKGLFTKPLLRRIIEAVEEARKPVLVDPERGQDYSRYRGATCLLPNRFEAETATRTRLDGEDACERAARTLLDELSLDSVVIKLDRDGMFYATADGRRRHVPTRPRSVVDVTGAGDMVAAVVGLMLASGANVERAVELANVAAGMEVSRRGACTVSRAELMAELLAESSPALLKIKSREELKGILAERRKAGDTVAFTNGVFDLLHLGHVELIRFARAQADCLVVGLNSDRSVRQLKGPERPINTEEVRAQTLASLPNVDYVVIFDEASVLPLIEELRPDVLVKGGDYGKTGVVGWQLVESYGGQVRLAPKVEGLSTTELIQRIMQNGERRNRKDTAADGGPA